MPDSDPSIRDESEFSEDPPGLTLKGEGGVGNRPAEGARQATPGDALNSAFQGSANAGDFLGLDVEVDEPTSVGGGLGLTSTQAPDDSTDAWEDDPDFEDEYEEDSFDESFEEEGFEGEEERFEELAPVKSHSGLYAGLAFVVGLLVVAGVVLGPKYVWNKDPGTQVASTGGGSPRTGEAPVVERTSSETPAQPTGTAAGIEATPTPDVTPTLDPVEANDELPTLSTGFGGTEDGGDGEAAGGMLDLLSRFTGGGSPDNADFEGTDTSQLPFDGGLPISGASFDPSLFNADGWMTGELVDMIWRDTSVPVEAIAHPARIMTPRVGNVRVHLKSAEVFEGRLYAVGQDRVWIEGAMGRLGLDGDMVDHFERVPPEVAQASTFDATNLGTGKRVRVAVPGGLLYGRVLSVVDERVTLITDDGGRIVLDAPEVEPLGPSRAILVER